MSLTTTEVIFEIGDPLKTTKHHVRPLGFEAFPHNIKIFYIIDDIAT